MYDGVTIFGTLKAELDRKAPTGEEIFFFFSCFVPHKKPPGENALIEITLCGIITTYQLLLQMKSVWKVIYQTRATVFLRDIQTPRRELKIRRAAEYF